MQQSNNVMNVGSIQVSQKPLQSIDNARTPVPHSLPNATKISAHVSLQSSVISLPDPHISSVNVQVQNHSTSHSPQFSLVSGPLSIAGLRSVATNFDLSILPEGVVDNSLSVADNQASSVGLAPTTGTDDVESIFGPNKASATPEVSENDSPQNIQEPPPKRDIERPIAGSGNITDESSRADQQDTNKAEDLAQVQQLKKLQARDVEVKSHEQAHATVGGQYAQSPNFEYQKGADGQRYAVSGEVQIDVSEVSGNPMATIAKMKQVYAAAMAPVDPSLADIQVATQALQRINIAKQQLAEQRIEQAPDVKIAQALVEASEGIAPLNPPKFGVSGNIDESGNIFRTQNESTSAIDDTVSRINDNFEEVVSDTSSPAVSVPTATLAYQYNNEQSSSSSTHLNIFA